MNAKDCRQIFFTALMAVMFLFMYAGTAIAQGSATPTMEGNHPQRFLVKFNSHVPEQTVAKINENNNARQEDVIPQLGVRILTVPPKWTAEEMVNIYRRDPNVEYAEVDTLRDLSETIPNDPYFEPLQYWLRAVSTPSAWDITSGHADVKIAILDTGVQLNHPDLVDRLLPGYDFANNDADPFDTNGHGTAVAGIAGATTNNGIGVAGVAPGTKLMPVQVCSPLCYDSAIASGLTYAADQGATVINMSLGGPSGSSTLKNAVDYAAGKGAILVAAAGNGSTSVYYPAAYPNVIAVAGLNGSALSALSYSNYGPQVDVSAPGELGATTALNSSYGSFAGTSAAAPVVSGVVGLMMSVNSGLTFNQVQDLIKNNSDDLGTAGYDNVYGWGRINADRLVRSLAPQPVDTMPPSVQVKNPAAGETYTGIVALQADATDNVSVDRVEFYSDDRLITTDSVAPYEASWDTTQEPHTQSQHNITAKAIDRSGNADTSVVGVLVDHGSASSDPQVLKFSGTVGGKGQPRSMAFSVNARQAGNLTASLSWTAKTTDLSLRLKDGAGNVIAVAGNARLLEQLNQSINAGNYVLEVVAVSGKASFVLDATLP